MTIDAGSLLFANQGYLIIYKSLTANEGVFIDAIYSRLRFWSPPD